MEDAVRVADVFGIGRRGLPLNYVVRPSVDAVLIKALSRDHHLVIYGSSKQGKTSVRKYNLQDDEYIVVSCLNRWTIAQMHSAILKAAGYTVVLSETRGVTGQQRIKATAGFVAKLFGSGVDTSVEIEGGREQSAERVEASLELDPSDVNDVISALREIQFDKFIVLEDFHYLPEETQKDFAVALKAYHEGSDLIFIIVGVWLQENRLTQFNGDLSGRVSTIYADKWSTAELKEAVTKGEQLLNIEFDLDFVDTLVANSFDSISVVQEACRLACEEADVNQKQVLKRVIRFSDPKKIISQVVQAQSARFNDFIVNFADGFGKTDLEMYRWLLVPVLTMEPRLLELGLPYRRLRKTLGRVHPAGATLNAGNVTQALQSAASLQVRQGVKPLVLDYDQSLKRLNVVDRSFLIWLGQQDPRDLLEAIDVSPDVYTTLFEAGNEEEED